jgi:hypothetical protein
MYFLLIKKTILLHVKRLLSKKEKIFDHHIHWQVEQICAEKKEMNTNIRSIVKKKKENRDKIFFIQYGINEVMFVEYLLIDLNFVPNQFLLIN